MFSHLATRRRACLALVLSCLTALPAAAQRFRRQNPMDGGQGGFQIGVMTLDLADLNSTLSAANYPGFNEQFLTIGGSGYGVRGRWLIGGEGQGLIGSDQATTNGLYSLIATGGYGLFRVGYNVVKGKSVDLYPTVGFGAGGVNIQIRGRSAPTFGDILTTPGRSSNLSAGGFVLGVGVAGDVRLNMAQERDSTVGGLMLGVSAGYVFQPVTSSWKLDQENSVAGGPTMKIQGAYARFTLGGWARARK